MSQPNLPGKKQSSITEASSPPAQCTQNDFSCLALQYHELYKYAVGTEGCINPPECSKIGRRPASLLAGLFKACNEEAAGDFNKFDECVSSLVELLEKAGQRVSIFRS